MLTIIYVLAACVITPLAYEMVNRKIAGNNRVINAIKGWPAYMVNVVICTTVAFVVCVLPGGPGVSLTWWALITFAIYFGNQFVYNTFVKLWAKTRAKVG
jgi:hypothetical protein